MSNWTLILLLEQIIIMFNLICELNDKLDPDFLPIYANMAINKRQNLTEIKANIKTLKSIKEE